MSEMTVAAAPFRACGACAAQGDTASAAAASSQAADFIRSVRCGILIHRPLCPNTGTREPLLSLASKLLRKQGTGSASYWETKRNPTFSHQPKGTNKLK